LKRIQDSISAKEKKIPLFYPETSEIVPDRCTRRNQIYQPAKGTDPGMSPDEITAVMYSVFSSYEQNWTKEEFAKKHTGVRNLSLSVRLKDSSGQWLPLRLWHNQNDMNRSEV